MGSLLDGRTRKGLESDDQNIFLGWKEATEWHIHYVTFFVLKEVKNTHILFLQKETVERQTWNK